MTAGRPDGFFEGDGIWWAVAFGVGGVLILCGNDGDNLVLCLPPAQCRQGITQWAAGVKMYV